MQSTTSKQRNSGARSSKLNPDHYEWLSVQRAHFTFSPRPTELPGLARAARAPLLALRLLVELGLPELWAAAAAAANVAKFCS